jgi:RNA polymerase sigma-70 factor (ECF subfamily)
MWKMAGEDPAPERFLELARHGDGTALGGLLKQYTAYLKLLARVHIGRRLQGKADASDLVQDTFLEAHRQFPLFRGTTEAEFVAWLRQILAGRLALLARHFLGTKGRDVRLERELAAELDQSSRILAQGLLAPDSTPSGQAARREQAVLLAEALDRLPEHYREVIVLRHLEDLPFAEVARRMGRSEDSVQKLWLRALAGLRRSLGGGP